MFAEHGLEHGANVIGPVSRPWNARGLTVIDPDGYRLVFATRVGANFGFGRLLRQVVKDGE